MEFKFGVYDTIVVKLTPLGKEIYDKKKHSRNRTIRFEEYELGTELRVNLAWLIDHFEYELKTNAKIFDEIDNRITVKD